MIHLGGKYGDIRKQASSDPTPHGLTTNTIEDLASRFESFVPGLASSNKVSSTFFDGLLPKGANLDPRTNRQANIPTGTSFPGFNGGGQGVQMTPQRPYQPEFESPDRQQYPVHRILANRYWRLFYKLDPVIGNCVEMLSTMPWSDFQLTGEGVSGEIKESFETMCQETQVLKILTYMAAEFLVIGECVPHCFIPTQEILLDNNELRSIDALAIGEKVVTHTGSIKNITEIHTREYDGDILKFNIYKQSALSVECTPEHPFYILKNDKPEWIRAKDIDIGDYVSVGVNKHIKDRDNIDLREVISDYDSLIKSSEKYNPKRIGKLQHIINIDEDLLRLIGYYFAEGFAVDGGNGRYSVRFAFHKNEQQYIDDVVELVKNKFGLDCSITTYENSNSTVVSVGSKIITLFFLNEFGTGCRNKKIPSWILNLPIEKQKGFLIGVLRGDGCLHIKPNSKTYSISMAMVSRSIIHATWQMLLKRGIPASFNISKKPKLGKSEIWWCNFGIGDWGTLLTDIWGNKAKEIIDYRPKHHGRYKIIDDKFYYKIEKIEKYQYSGLVYNLEVEDDHSYIAGGISSHNCFFDEGKGIWTYIALHNPDQLEVIDAPFIKMDPVVEFIPDDRLRSVLTSNNHLLRKVREQMPPELISRLIARQNIPLSPVNMTFIPRRLHPYDTRGTSIISRMWRILMYEDSQVPGTPITRPDGTNTPIEQIKIGDLVVSKDGDIQQVTYISEKYSPQIMDIKIHGGWLISCTKNHKWPIFKKIGRQYKSNKTLTENIKIGDYLSIPRKFVKSKLDKYSNVEMARLLGYYVAEGSRFNHSSQYKGKKYNYHYGLSWSLSLNEKDTLAKDIINLCKKIGCDTKFYIGKVNRSRNACSVRSHKKANMWLADWMFANGGEHAASKKLSQMVMGWPLRLKREFIKGYFLGDGSYNLICNNITKNTKRKAVQSSVRAATISKDLAYQIQLILAQLGVFAKIRAYQPPNNDGKNRKEIYYIEASGHHGDKLGLIVWGKVRDRIIADHKCKSRVVITKDHVLLPVTKISIEKYNGLVYSLSTSGDHSYLNANVATYNSIYNASIATARRHAGPIKVAKLGNPQTGWIPSQEHERRLLQLLSQAELDVNSWLVYHYGINFELIGTTDRIMNISQHHDVIERIKLIALGISKSFLHGEVTYACLDENTSVLMSNYKYKPIQDVEEGDLIIDKDGQIQTVEKNWCEGAPKELYQISLCGNKKINATDIHRWPVWAWPRTCACGCNEEVKPGKCFVQHHHERTGGRYSKVKLKYVDGETCVGGKPRQIPITHNPIQKLKSSDLRASDFLMVPRKFKHNKPSVSLDQARLLGYYISEGCKNSSHGKLNGIRWSFNIDEAESYAKDVIDICKNINIIAKTAKYIDKQTSVVSAFGDESRKLFKWCKKHGGEYSYAKILSKHVMQWPIKYKIELIKGMYFGDGSQYFHNVKNRQAKQYKQFMVVYTTVSELLANQLQIILAQIGYYAIIDVEKERIGKDGSKRRKLYLVKTYGEHARNLSKLIWNKESKADTVKNNIRDSFRVDDDYIYVPIRSIKIVKNTKSVYNLSVTGSCSYLANGVGTYNSSITGLSVFLQRLRAMRDFFVNTWLLPKFFKPVAMMNGWVKRDKGELAHRYRIKRSHKEIELENRWIVPKIEWQKQLDHNINTELVSAMTSLEQLGIKFSKTTKYATVGKKFEDEINKIAEEQELETSMKQYVEENKPDENAPKPGGGGGIPMPPLGGGSGASGVRPTPPRSPPPGIPGTDSIPNAAPPGGGPATAPPPGGPTGDADKSADGGGSGPSGKKDPAVRDLTAPDWDDKGRYGNWSATEVQDLIELLIEGYTDSPFWEDMKTPKLQASLNAGDPMEVLEVIEEHLNINGYPPSDMLKLKEILDKEGILNDISCGGSAAIQIETKMPDDTGIISDKNMANKLSSYIDGEKTGPIKTENTEDLLVGHGNHSAWIGDISGFLNED